MIPWYMPYILLIAGLSASLVIFVSMKREMRTSAVRTRKRIEEIARRLEEVQARGPEPVYVPGIARSGLNIGKRVQAMRMVRRNESMSHISAALGVPQKEVELLIRVQKMSAAPVFGKAIGAASGQ
jgi:hypothetical protein